MRFRRGSGSRDLEAGESRSDAYAASLKWLRYSKSGSPDLLNLTYSYQDTANNNGQIQKITDVLDGNKTLKYTYDALARLKIAETANLTAANTYKLQWDYDRYGNRKSQTLLAGTAGVTQPQVSVDASTNRISTAGFQYDAAGNLTNDTLHTYTYDAENRVKTIDGAAAGYVYDGAGLRVKTSSTLYIFAGAKVIAEYPSNSTTPSTPDREYVYSGGQLLATFAGSAVKFSYPDHLSTRVEADSMTCPLVLVQS
jgi:YD repeat-containing protein